MAFQGDGFVELDAGLRSFREQEISFSIRTSVDNGVVYWHGQDPTVSGVGKDYVALAIVDGFLQFRLAIVLW